MRVLKRGNKQFLTGETEGPVARVESIKVLLSIAAHENLAVFKVDIGSAFMQTPMVDDVKHKWVHLPKLVVKILQELKPGVYEPYILGDGTMIMEMTKIRVIVVELLDLNLTPVVILHIYQENNQWWLNRPENCN